MVYRQSLKVSFIIFSAFFLSSHVFAKQKEQPFSLGDPLKAAIEAEKIVGLKTSNLEINQKGELIRKRINEPKKFFEVKEDALENPPLYQSWADETEEALKNIRNLPHKIEMRNNEEIYRRFFKGTPIDTAKKIAKGRMLIALHDNWQRWLKDSSFNDTGTDDWNNARSVYIDKLKNLFHYSPRHSRGDKYVFIFDSENPCFVEISKATLRTGRVGLDINSLHDSNHLEEGADKIQADTDVGPPKDSLSPPAGGDKGEL